MNSTRVSRSVSRSTGRSLQNRVADELQKLVEDRLQPLHLRLENGEPAEGPLVPRPSSRRFEVLLDQAEVQADRRQRVADLVGKAREQTS